jgi:hypothetical protein
VNEAFVYPVGGACAGVVDGWALSRRELGVDGASESGTLNIVLSSILQAYDVC